MHACPFLGLSRIPWQSYLLLTLPTPAGPTPSSTVTLYGADYPDSSPVNSSGYSINLKNPFGYSESFRSAEMSLPSSGRNSFLAMVSQLRRPLSLCCSWGFVLCVCLPFLACSTPFQYFTPILRSVRVFKCRVSLATSPLHPRRSSLLFSSLSKSIKNFAVVVAICLPC